MCSRKDFTRYLIPTIPKAEWFFPHFEIDEIKNQEARDLARFDLDFDLSICRITSCPSFHHPST
jgi:hypothetical protein